MSTIYIVSTPIGNLQDITLRAAITLLNTHLIIAESASKAGILLNFLEKQFAQKRIVDQKIISMSEDEEEQKIPGIIRLLQESDAALISEAGTPLISDPGFKLVRESIKRGINIVSIPGPTAAICALTSSGLPPDRFVFLGYLPKKEGKRMQILKSLNDARKLLNSTIILYESPHRLLDTLRAIEQTFGDIDIVIARELTKIYEEIRRERVSESIRHFGKNTPKGEFIILF